MRDFDIWFDKRGGSNAITVENHFVDFTEEEKEYIRQEFDLNMGAQYNSYPYDGKKWYKNLFTKNFKAGMIMVFGTVFMMSTEFSRFWLEFLVDILIASVAWHFFEKTLEGKK